MRDNSYTAWYCLFFGGTIHEGAVYPEHAFFIQLPYEHLWNKVLNLAGEYGFSTPLLITDSVGNILLDTQTGEE
jgi:hypothetical protein